MYRTDVYFIGKMLAEVPFYILFPFMTVLIIYFLIGLQLEVGAFVITAGIYILVANCAVSIGKHTYSRIGLSFLVRSTFYLTSQVT